MSDRPLRILLTGPVAPPRGGMSRYAQDLMHSELAARHEMSLFRDNVPWGYRPQATSEAATWNILRRDGVRATARVLGFVARRMWDLASLLRSGGFDGIHILSTGGYGFFRNVVHVGIARRYGVRAVLHLLGQIDDLYRDARPWLRRVISAGLDVADAHIVQSPALACFVRGITRRPVYSIFNGVRVEELAPPDGYAHGDADTLTVLSLGVLGHKKGTYDLLEAVRRLKALTPAVRAVFVGGGEVERFRRAASDLGVQDDVVFTGEVDDEVRVKFLHTADVFALPSRAEGQPIALLEALAAGLPVISTTVGSIPEVVGSNNGILVAPGDVGALVAAIGRLAGDGQLRERIGRFNAQEAATKYRLERVMQEIGAVYAEVFAR